MSSDSSSASLTQILFTYDTTLRRAEDLNMCTAASSKPDLPCTAKLEMKAVIAPAKREGVLFGRGVSIRQGFLAEA